MPQTRRLTPPVNVWDVGVARGAACEEAEGDGSKEEVLTVRSALGLHAAIPRNARLDKTRRWSHDFREQDAGTVWLKTTS